MRETNTEIPLMSDSLPTSVTAVPLGGEPALLLCGKALSSLIHEAYLSVSL